MVMINILFKDEHLIIADKPSGLLVHPYWQETDEKACLMKMVRDQEGSYVYPANRLDRPVSGPVLFGLSSEIIKEIQFNWHLANTKKEYIAMVKGVIEEAGEFNFRLKNDKNITQKARTLYTPLANFKQTTLVKVTIKTGRKHQIRRHFSRRCQNIIGDTKRGNSQLNHYFRDELGLERIFLHCHRLALEHPITEEMIDVRSPLSENLVLVLQNLGMDEEEINLLLEKNFS
jgi:tRNA pseudouridine65 synthase